MKRLLFLSCLISVCIYSSCDPDTVRRIRMETADAFALQKCQESIIGQTTPPGANNAICNAAAAKASDDAGKYVVHPLSNQINPNIRVPRNLLLELNPYEAEGDMHNDALDFIIREELAGVDVSEKLRNRDRETIDKLLKLSPALQDDNVRKEAVDAAVAMEIPDELKERLTKITYAKDYVEAISYLDMPADKKAFVTEVFATCNDYYANEADFEQVAGYLNDKIALLLNKGKDITIEEQRLAYTFTIFKHSYYYWHGTK